jgi:AcrR family transcriptional regulator
MRADGIRSREAILDGASRLATVEGLDGLSIGRLSDEIGMSKSGLYAHFGSKEQLQLATIDYAEAIFQREVIDPALAAPAGRERVIALSEAFFEYLQAVPGGCFFASAAAELAPREGPVRERIRAFLTGFIGLIERELGDAQLAFEVDALMLGANASYTLFGDPAAIDRARAGIERTLEAAGR